MSAIAEAREPSTKRIANADAEPTLVRAFEVLTTAPNGVASLREMILSLAVQGRLAQQDRKEEPAATLLQRIAKAAGRSKPELATDLPLPSWVRTTFGEYVLELCTGPFGSLIGKNEYVNGGVPLVNPSHMKNGRIEAQASISVSPAKATQLKAYMLAAGDVVFARRGEVGRTALVTDNESGWLCGTGSFFARLHADIDRAYLQLVFNSPSMRAYLGGAAVGATMVNLNQRVLLNAPMDIPPVSEQHRIVARVDELMKLCDALEQSGRLADEQHVRLTSTLFDALAASESVHALAENWQRIVEHFDLLLDRHDAIDALEQTIMRLAPRGLLVAQHESDASANEAMVAIDREKERLTALGQMKRTKPPVPVADQDQLFSVPPSWLWVRVADLCSVVTDGEHATPQRCDDATAIPLVTAKNVRSEVMDYAVTDFVPREVAEKCWSRCKPEPGDILMVSVGATLGRLCVLRDPVDMVIVRSVSLLRPIRAGVYVDYLALHLMSMESQGEIWSEVKQSAQPGLYLAKTAALRIALPPLAEQRRIVARVQELRHLCADLRQRLTQAQETQSRLADALAGR